MHDRRVQPWSVAQCEGEEKRKKGKGRGEKSLKTVKDEDGEMVVELLKGNLVKLLLDLY